MYYYISPYYIFLIMFAKLSHDHVIIFRPFNSGGIEPWSFFLMCIPITGIPSSLAHFISHLAPLECHVFLLKSTIMPSQDLILVRHFCFHICSSQGCLTDISTKVKGERSFFACATKKSLYCSSSIAKLIKIRFFISLFDSSSSSKSALRRRATAPAPSITGHIFDFFLFSYILVLVSVGKIQALLVFCL